MASTPLAILGNFMMKSMVISSYFHIGMGNSWTLPCRRWCLALTFRKVKHRFTNHAIFHFIQGYQ